ncbi:MAG: PAS domain-containing protein [Proteobacteria bacterium]|nr:PAS domain-containing protein [Pseudomonadota bacterium]
MTAMRRDLAMNAFAKLSLSPMNIRLAQYWLSLWDSDRLPFRAQLSPARMKDLLPGIGIFEVRAGESSRCRLAGTAIQRALGREIAGADWRAYTPRHQHAERLERNSIIAKNAIGIGTRCNSTADGVSSTQELQLPFADQTEDGARLILFHLDWRPESILGGIASIEPVPIADRFDTVSLLPSQ